MKKEMATHSSILAWEIPWIEEPGELQSMGSQRVGHNLVIKQQNTSSITKDSFQFTIKISVKIIMWGYSLQRLCYDLCSKVSLYVLNNLVLIFHILSTFMCIKSDRNDVLTLSFPNYA